MAVRSYQPRVLSTHVKSYSNITRTTTLRLWHNHKNNGTTDLSQTVTARQTHACYLLAGAADQQGQSHELDFYCGMHPQECATTFLASAGVPMFGDPFRGM